MYVVKIVHVHFDVIHMPGGVYVFFKNCFQLLAYIKVT